MDGPPRAINTAKVIEYILKALSLENQAHAALVFVGDPCVVEGYPEETADRTLSGSFLHTGPMTAFENHGFTRMRQIAPHRWVVTKVGLIRCEC
jgi:hypothetical protein